MTKVINILVGPPGSGKSTFAKQAEQVGFVRISQDDQGREGHYKLFDSALVEGRDIVVDRMNFDKNQRIRYITPALKAGYNVVITVFHAPRTTCFERIMARENHPTINGIDPDYGGGKAAICYTEEQELQHKKEDEERALQYKSRQANSALDTFFTKYQRPTEDEASKIVNVGWENARGRALVVDIDGTIADIEHRRHFVDRTKGKPNWKAFFDYMDCDQPNKWCVDLVNAMLAASDRMTPEQQPYQLVFASGRPDSYRTITEKWLTSALGYQKWQHLLMRHRQDSRQDNVVKEIILEFELKTRYKDLLIIDDRKQVVDMWRSHGYTVLQCAEGDF